MYCACAVRFRRSTQQLTNYHVTFDVPTQKLSVFKSFVDSQIGSSIIESDACAFDQLRYFQQFNRFNYLSANSTTPATLADEFNALVDASKKNRAMLPSAPFPLSRRQPHANNLLKKGGVWNVTFPASRGVPPRKKPIRRPSGRSDWAERSSRSRHRENSAARPSSRDVIVAHRATTPLCAAAPTKAAPQIFTATSTIRAFTSTTTARFIARPLENAPNKSLTTLSDAPWKQLTRSS